MAFCAKCGNQLDADIRFCDKCGQAMGGVSAAPVAQPPSVAVSYYTQAAVPTPSMRAVSNPPRTKKPKGMVSKIIGIVLVAAVVFLLNYFGIPGYIAALVLGLWGSTALLGKNQNGKFHEKLALLGAALLGTATYCLAGLRFGAYAGTLVFIGVGLGLTRLYKRKTGIKAWLLEVAPPVLSLSLFERVGGAVSNVPGILDGIPIGVIARYVEAALLLVAFVVVQSLHSKQSTGSLRKYSAPKRKGLRNFGKFIIVIVILLVWFNPFGALVFDNIKSNVWDLLDGYGKGKSVVTTISNTNGTSLLMVKGAGSVTSEVAALELLSQYDKELDGEYAFVDSIVLPSGNTLYRFAQVIKKIAVDGGAKNLIVDASGKPHYVVGQTKIITKGLSIPSNILNDSQAKKVLQELFDGLDASFDTLEQVWYFAGNMEQSSYRLAYKATLVLKDEAEEPATCSAILDAATGEILDVSFEDEGYAAVLQNAKLSGTFENADFVAITKAADQIMSGTQVNAWRYRDVLEQECLSFYAHKGNEKLGKSNAAALVKAFANAGAKGTNVDEGVVKVDLKSSRVTLKGTINFPYNADDIIVTQSSGMAQGYTIKTAVPITIVVQNTKGEHILTLPAFDMETFELYPANEEEQYVFTIQGGNRFQSTTKTSYAPALPGMIMAQAAGDDLYTLAGLEVDASYTMTIEQLSRSSDSSAQSVKQLLRKVEQAYNDNNGARYVALYRLDDFTQMVRETVLDPMSQLGPEGDALKRMISPIITTRWYSVIAQTLLVSYRAANNMILPMWNNMMDSVTKSVGSTDVFSDVEIEKMVSDAPDKTAIVATLFALNGRLDYFNGMSDPRSKEYGLLNRLDGTTLKLNEIGRTTEGAKTYVTVEVEISRGNTVVLKDTVTILVQRFGEAAGGGPADYGPDAAWYTNILDRMKSTFTTGTYLGLDLERTMNLWFEGIEAATNTPGNGGNGGNEQEKEQEQEEKAKVTTPWKYDNSSKYYDDLAQDFALYSMLAYDESAYCGSNYYTKDPPRKKKPEPTELMKRLSTDGYKCVEYGNYGNTNEHDISYTLAHKMVSGKMVLAVILRGTDSVEWRGNMDVWMNASTPSNRHYSFQHANESLQWAVNNYIITKLQNYSGDIIFFVTGHSRGAAVANLFAADLNRNAAPFESKKENVFCYTFATPNNTTDSSKGSKNYNNIFNFCFEDDFVPQVPLEKWGYGKYGRTFKETAEALFNRNSTFANKMDNYIKSTELFNGNWSFLWRKPEFNFAATNKVLQDFHKLAGDVHMYYNKKYQMAPGELRLVEWDQTLHGFMRNYIANAAINPVSIPGIGSLLKQMPLGNDVQPIADFFIDGVSMKKSINDTHQAFTYYAALKSGGFPTPK